ncbi:hypothetical protein EGI32_15280 [Ferruginibacter sp. HRS2-29]|nr:hypothetical protein [Ferruginibacter sp. HRS2-29]MCP9752324.1 hypothetical protein [Ferruginibacter sp. HRS2-29]
MGVVWHGEKQRKAMGFFGEINGRINSEGEEESIPKLSFLSIILTVKKKYLSVVLKFRQE